MTTAPAQPNHSTYGRTIQPHAYNGVVDAPGGPAPWDTAPVLACWLDPSIGYRFFDDFTLYEKSGGSTAWTIAADAGGTTGQDSIDAVGGVYRLAPDGDDNDGATLTSDNEVFLPVAGKDIWFRAKVAATDGTTAGKSSYFVGFSDDATIDLIDDAGTMASSYDGFGFFKGEDDTNWSYVTSNGSTQTAVDSGVAYTSGADVKLAFRIDTSSSNGAATGSARVLFYIDDVYVGYSDVALSGLAEMHVAASVKTHAAAATEPQMDLDYFDVLAIR